MPEPTDPSTSCQASCEAPVPDGLYLCRAHTDLLAADLELVPDIVADLDVTITRQNRTVAERHGSRSSTMPLPWNEHAAVKAAELATVLNQASIDVATVEQDERDPLIEVAAYDSANLARWLRRNITTACRTPGAGDLFASVNDAVVGARRATDRPPDHVFAGPCREDRDGEVCTGDVYGVPGSAWASCNECRTRHDAALRREWMLSEIEDQATHSGLLASLVTGLGQPIGSSTIRKWAAAGRLKVISVDQNHRKLYRIGDVLALLHPERVAA